MTDRADVLSERGLRHASLVLLATLPLGAAGLLTASQVPPPLGPVLLVVLTLLPASLAVGLVGRGWEDLCGSYARANLVGLGLVGAALAVGLAGGAAVAAAGLSSSSLVVVLVGATVGLALPAGALAVLGSRVRRRLLVRA